MAGLAYARPGCDELVRARLGHQAVVKAAEFLPTHCRVTGTIERTIGFEVDLPVEWNHKLLVFGIGGNAGSITDMSLGWKRNYATATTDTGHKGLSAGTSWALRNPRGELNFAERAFHLTTVAAKELVKLFYGTAERQAYFTGCSGGGRQAMIEAQRFPNDFDGIIAGAPGYDLTGFHLAFIWNAQAMFPDAANLPQPVVNGSQLKLLEARVLAKCDALDGLVDGIIDDPRRCKFDPTRDLPICPGTANCFTPAQAMALTKIYTGARNRQGQIYPGFQPGVESAWNTWIAEGTPAIKPLGPNLSYAFGEGFLRYWVYDDPTYKLSRFDFEKDVAATARIGRLVNATNPNLKAFQKHGGKIIFYHGWADNAFPAAGTIKYYEQLQRTMDDVGGFARLFLVPGMAHCGGGPGCHQVDYLTALEAWVEKGQAPGQIRGTGTNPVRSRPICVYPNVARYKGDGSQNDAANFRCAAPGKIEINYENISPSQSGYR